MLTSRRPLCICSYPQLTLHLHVGLYPFRAVLFCASSSLVQQHDAQHQMRWDQAHHLVGPALLLQWDLNEVLAHPEKTTKEVNLTPSLCASDSEPDTNNVSKTREFVLNYNG